MLKFYSEAILYQILDARESAAKTSSTAATPVVHKANSTSYNMPGNISLSESTSEEDSSCNC